MEGGKSDSALAAAFLAMLIGGPCLAGLGSALDSSVLVWAGLVCLVIVFGCAALAAGMNVWAQLFGGEYSKYGGAGMPRYHFGLFGRALERRRRRRDAQQRATIRRP